MSEKDPERGKWIPVAIIAFFVVVAIANVVFLYYAMKTHPGLETEDAYEEGLNYNDELARAEASKELGWQGTLTVGEGGKLVVSIVDSAGDPIPDLAVSAVAVWPVKEGFDTEIIFAPEGDAYSAAPALPMSGQWEIRLRAEDAAGNVYRFAERVVL